MIERLALSTFQFGIPLNVRANGIWAPPGQSERFYFTDSISNTVGTIELATGISRVIAGGDTPAGPAIGYVADTWLDAPNLYFSDNTAAIRKLDLRTGSVTTIATVTHAGPLWGNGTHLFVNSAGSAIAKVDLTTGVSTTLATFPPRSNFIAGQMWGDDINLYVPNMLAGGISKIDQVTGVRTPWLNSVRAAGIWGTNGSLFLGAKLGCILRIDIATQAVSTLPVCTDVGGFWDVGSSLFVTTGTSVIRINLDDNSVTTIAGSADFPGSEDGRGSAARFIRAGRVVSDGTSLYISDGQSLRKLVPVPSTVHTHGTAFAFDLESKNGVSVTGGQPALPVMGYARIETSSGSIRGGMATVGFRPNDVLVHEFGITPLEPLRSGRIPIEAGGPAMTGLAVANANAAAVTINFFFTDREGIDFNPGSFVIGSGEQIARFVDQAPFSSTPWIRPISEARTMTFSASFPVAVTAIRGFVNERSEFLTSTLPVTPTTSSATGPVIFPHFAHGDGWVTEILLINPTNQPITGSLGFFDGRPGIGEGAGGPIAVTIDGLTQTNFPYTIPARSSRTFQVAGSPPSLFVGYVAAVPAPGSISPAGVLLFSFRRDRIRVTEASIPSSPPATVFQLYGEADDAPGTGMAPLVTGLAIANPSSTATARVEIEFLTLDGEGMGVQAGGVVMPPHKQIAGFITQLLPSLPPLLPLPIRGLIRITSTSPVSVTAFQTRYNERDDFLISSTALFDEAGPAPSTGMLFPHFIDGGDYTTRFVLLGDPAQETRGTLLFFDQTGKPFDMTFR